MALSSQNMCGGGTIPAAAASLGRRIWTCDIEEQACALTAARVVEAMRLGAEPEPPARRDDDPRLRAARDRAHRFSLDDARTCHLERSRGACRMA